MSFCTSTSSGPAGQIFMLAGHATTKLDPCLSVRIVNFSKKMNFDAIVRISKKRPFLPGTVNHDMSFCTSTSSGPAGQIFMLAGHATTKLDPCLSVRIVNFSKKMTFRVRIGKKGHFEQIFFIINFLEFKSVIMQNLMTFGVFEKLFNFQNSVNYHIFQSVITFFLFVRLKK